MAAGALGSVSNRLRHENGDTHVVDCDDVFSDAGSTPAASTTFPEENEQISSFFPPPPLFLHKTQQNAEWHGGLVSLTLKFPPEYFRAIARHLKGTGSVPAASNQS